MATPLEGGGIPTAARPMGRGGGAAGLGRQRGRKEQGKREEREERKKEKKKRKKEKKNMGFGNPPSLEAHLGGLLEIDFFVKPPKI